MRCSTCPSDRHTHCRNQGCHAASAIPIAPSPGAAGDLDLQVRRLDVENGDILVLRTAQKLSPEKADEWNDMLIALARRHGARDVTVVLLDNCTDLTVERLKRG